MDEMLESSHTDEESKTVSREGASNASDTHGQDVILEPTTVKAFEDNMVDDIDDDNRGWSTRHIALWPTKKTVNKHIIGYKQVMADRKGIESFYPESYYDEDDRQNEISRLIEEGVEFKKKTNKKVSVLVREFERRKAAYQYSDRKSTRLNSSHSQQSRMPSSA